MSSTSMSKNSRRSSSVRSRHDAQLITQTPIDAQLASNFEESKQLFDYSSSVDLNLSTSNSNIPSSTVSSYLQKIQRGSLIQSFGCLIAIDEQNFTVLAFSENAPELMELASHDVPTVEQQEDLMIGTDVRTLFTSSGASALQNAITCAEVSLLNPVLLHCKNSGKPFYAILHRIDVGLVIDLEPVNLADVLVTTSGAFKSYKLAAKAISKLQSLPNGNILLLCDVLVKEVRELTGYDRVMVYKFHEDEHGEVIAEYCRQDLEPFLGLHYPATDIPQASRFLFLKNKLRMICDCLASPIKLSQDKNLAQPLSLGGSTLRAPHGCHAQYMANMGSVASLVMAVTVDEDEDEDEDDDAKRDQKMRKKLWGLVVCHHTSSRYVPYPLRYACELLVQVFGIQINKEVELAAQVREKHILRIQTVLCDMLLRDSPVAIVTQTPNVTDLVKCDGAALYFEGKVWLIGVTPTEKQIMDIVDWLLEYHGNTKGLSTDSLMEAGYPGASELGEAVCGMASIRISLRDILFWFRSHTAKEIKWGGAKHDPKEIDDRRKMNPRSSFKAFLEVVKWRSLPWDDMEMDVIHSLQLILRGYLQNNNAKDTENVVENSKMIVHVSEPNGLLHSVNQLRAVTKEMVRLIDMAVVPIFSVDASAIITGWNVKVAELTGLPVEQAIGLSLCKVVVHEACEVVKNMLSLALRGIEEKDVEIRLKTYVSRDKNDPVALVVNTCCNRDMHENVTGICFIGQDVTSQKKIMDKYTRVQGDYAGIMRKPCHLIPPIFIIDDQGICLEWNDAIEKLSGLSKEAAIGRMLLGEVFTLENISCQVKDADNLTKLRILINKILAGENADKVLFGFFDRQGQCIDALLSASPRTNAEGKVTGVLCFLHVPSPELQYTIQMQKMSEMAADNTRNKLVYLRQQIRNPISGIIFIRKLMGSTDLDGEQRKLLVTRSSCEDQLIKIVDDIDIQRIEEGFMDMNSTEFNLGEVINTVLKQVMPSSQERQIQVVCDSPTEVSSMYLYGDYLRLQQVLADFLSNSIHFTPEFKGSLVTLVVNPRREYIGTKMQILHVEFRIMHPSPGVPEDLIQEMIHPKPSMSREGLGMSISHKFVRIMNGTVRYLRGEESSAFIVLLEFPFALDIVPS